MECRSILIAYCCLVMFRRNIWDICNQMSGRYFDDIKYGLKLSIILLSISLFQCTHQDVCIDRVWVSHSPPNSSSYGLGSVHCVVSTGPAVAPFLLVFCFLLDCLRARAFILTAFHISPNIFTRLPCHKISHDLWAAPSHLCCPHLPDLRGCWYIYLQFPLQDSG